MICVCIGGYHKEKGLVLIMDTARFKYPPFWVSISTLWRSMCVVDKATGSPRGYFVVSTASSSSYTTSDESGQCEEWDHCSSQATDHSHHHDHSDHCCAQDTRVKEVNSCEHHNSDNFGTKFE